MCEPATAMMGIGAAMSAASAYQGVKSRNDAIEGQNKAAAANVKTQRKYAKDNKAAFENTLGSYENAAADPSAGPRVAAVEQSMRGPGVSFGVPGGVPGPVASMMARTINEKGDEGRARAVAGARLAGAGDGAVGRSMIFNRNASDIGFNNRASQRSLGLLDLQMQELANRGAPGIGAELAGLGGNFLTAYGAMGGGIPGMGGAPAVPRGGGTVTNKLTGLRGGGV